MKYLEFIELIEAAGRKEKRILEFKRSKPWGDSSFRAKLVKAILAMSNVQGGGRIIIGMEQQDDGSFSPRGMKDEDFKTYNEEDAKDFVNNYADPFADFDMEDIPDAPSKFIMITVREFPEIPVICKKPYGKILIEGGIYTRTMGKRPRSALVSSQNEMREIIELAVDKGMEKLRRRGYKKDSKSLIESMIELLRRKTEFL